MPTLGELIRVAKRFGWRLGNMPGVRGPRGMVRIRYLIRRGDFVDLQDTKDVDRLTRIAVDSLCRRLGIPPEEFGLSRGDTDAEST
jgi:hypothetical protein